MNLSEYHERTQKTFYPTPNNIAEKMLQLVDWKYVRSMLQPSAGKGNLAKQTVCSRWLYQHPRRYTSDLLKDAISSCDMDCIEIDGNLREQLTKSGFRVVHDDFATFRTFKHYDLIVMNPPFDQGAEHLLKALQLIDGGGQVVCLLNAETIRNPCSQNKRLLLEKLTKNGASIEYMSNAFSDAERKTDVEIAIVYCKIEPKEMDSTILQNMKNAPDYEPSEIPQQYSEIVRYNGIDSWISKYEYEVACGLKLINEYQAMKRIMPDSFEEISLSVKTDENFCTVQNNYLRQVRRKYWRLIFQQPMFTDRLTQNLQHELQNNVNKFANYDFSVFNILTLAIRMSNKVNTGIEETILDLFDNWTGKYHWSQTTANRHYYDGWRTNDCFKVGSKVIIPIYGIFKDGWQSKWRFDYWAAVELFEDVQKVFDFLDAGRTSYSKTVREIMKEVEGSEEYRNIDTKFFTVTLYKKGTAHLRFKDEKLLQKLNIFAGQRKNWLPPVYGKKHYKDMTEEEQKVVDGFQGKESYEAVIRESEYYLPVSNSNIFSLPQKAG